MFEASGHLARAVVQRSQSATADTPIEQATDNAASDSLVDHEPDQRLASGSASGEERSAVDNQTVAKNPDFAKPLPPVTTSAAMLMPGGSEILNIEEEDSTISHALAEELIQSGEPCRSVDATLADNLNLEGEVTSALPQSGKSTEKFSLASVERPATHPKDFEVNEITPAEHEAQLVVFTKSADPSDDPNKGDVPEQLQRTQDPTEEEWDVAPEPADILIGKVQNDVTTTASPKPSRTARDAITAAVVSKDKRKGSSSKTSAKPKIVEQESLSPFAQQKNIEKNLKKQEKIAKKKENKKLRKVTEGAKLQEQKQNMSGSRTFTNVMETPATAPTVQGLQVNVVPADEEHDHFEDAGEEALSAVSNHSPTPPLLQKAILIVQEASQHVREGSASSFKTADESFDKDEQASFVPPVTYLSSLPKYEDQPLKIKKNSPNLSLPKANDAAKGHSAARKSSGSVPITPITPSIELLNRKENMKSWGASRAASEKGSAGGETMVK